MKKSNKILLFGVALTTFLMLMMPVVSNVQAIKIKNNKVREDLSVNNFDEKKNKELKDSEILSILDNHFKILETQGLWDRSLSDIFGGFFCFILGSLFSLAYILISLIVPPYPSPACIIKLIFSLPAMFFFGIGEIEFNAPGCAFMNKLLNFLTPYDPDQPGYSYPLELEAKL